MSNSNIDPLPSSRGSRTLALPRHPLLSAQELQLERLRQEHNRQGQNAVDQMRASWGEFVDEAGIVAPHYAPFHPGYLDEQSRPSPPRWTPARAEEERLRRMVNEETFEVIMQHLEANRKRARREKVAKEAEERRKQNELSPAERATVRLWIIAVSTLLFSGFCLAVAMYE
ncbi:hypothetical protein BXZ70DRAFT_534637 [Cristinia sonorae]|uniref:Uncharacterized protein n=1 Tax=Cristinia sonorae TaxID=1940300 RepID=A0A8K0UIG1_9AGAR|nr:hypothetical protein BXZ70DRAFT_534637 [Cristinia sonorae]